MTAFIQVDWSVKFRAMGITFGNYSDSRIITLPQVVQLAAPLLGEHTLYSYNNHGVVVSVKLKDKAS